MKKWFTIVIIFAIVGCRDKSLPDNIMGEERMADILLDIYMAESRMSQRNPTKYSSKDVFPIYKQKILEEHQVADSVYRRNMQYYLTHPIIMNRVYDIMIDSLKVWKEEFNSDSLRVD